MIWVDKNEGRSPRIQQMEDVGLKFSWDNLKVGDIKVDNTYVEVKEIGDYIDSLLSGHLNNQLVEMSHNCALSYLIVIGNLTEALYGHNISQEHFISSMVGCSFEQAVTGKQGIVVTVNVDNIYQFALFIKYLEKKSADPKPRLPVMEKIRWTRRDQVHHIIASIPSLGVVRSSALLEHFKSVKNVANASPDELQVVFGIGRELADSIYLAFNMEV